MVPLNMLIYFLLESLEVVLHFFILIIDVFEARKQI